LTVQKGRIAAAVAELRNNRRLGMCCGELIGISPQVTRPRSEKWEPRKV
jgi:hypothetical protein